MLKKVSGFSFGTLLSRITGMAREIVFAYIFGSSAVMDAFRVAFNIPNLLRDFFGEGGMNAAFVPIFSEFMEKKGRREANRYLSSFLLPLVLILITIITAGIIFAPQILSVLARGFVRNPEQFETGVRLTRIMFPFLLFISLASVSMGILTYFDRFFVSGVYPVFFNLSVIGCSFLLYRNFGIVAASMGVLLGGALQLVFLTLFLPSQGIRLKKPEWGHPGVIKSMKLIYPVFLAYAATRINVTVTLFLASLLPEGSISYMSYAYRIMQLPLGMFGVGVAAVSLPELSRKFASMEKQDRSIVKSLRSVLLLSIPSMLILIVLRTPAVRILFEHGAFTPRDTVITSEVLLFYLLGIPFIATNKFLRNIYFSRKDTKTPMKISYLSMIINVILAVILMVKMGVTGLALSVSIAGFFQFAMLIRPHMKKVSLLKNFIFKILLISIVSSIPVYFIQVNFSAVPSLISGVVSFGLIFIALSYIMDVDEICRIIKK